MPITEAQRALRRKHIGSSDMPAILGLDPYKTSYDVWLDKVGKLIDQEENEQMLAGSMFEDGILNWFASKHGAITRNQYRSSAEHYLGANVDAILNASGDPVEVKTSGLFGPLDPQWGDFGSDEVPPRVIVQCHCHMIVTARDVCHVPAFLGGRGFGVYVVRLQPSLSETIKREATRFWEQNVLKGVPPEGETPSIDVLPRVRRIPQSVATISAALVASYEELRSTRLEAEKAEEKAKAALVAAMGESEAADWGDADRWATYFETERGGYVVKPSTYRQLKITKKAGKKGKSK